MHKKIKVLENKLTYFRPVYIEICVCVVKVAVKCSFEFVCVVQYTTSRTYIKG